MHDVAIAGAGPAGLAAAIALAERGFDVCVVGPLDGTAQTRSEMVAHGAGAILKRLGLQPVISDALSIAAVRSNWGAAALQSHGAAPGLGLYGWGIDRHRLNRAMRARAKALGVTLRQARVTKTVEQNDGWHLRLAQTKPLDPLVAKRIIDATGRPAHVARRHGAHAYHDTPLVAVLWYSPNLHDPFMTAEAAPDGWWYAVPSTSGTTIGFVTDAATAKLIARDPQHFLDTATPGLSCVIAPATHRISDVVDCRNAILDQAFSGGWIAAGDAHAAFDPIASQGLFNALSGGFFAGNAAADALLGDQDAPRIYAALAERTADRTHRLTQFQYAALPFDTPFWRHRATGHSMRSAVASSPRNRTAICNTSA